MNEAEKAYQAYSKHLENMPKDVEIAVREAGFPVDGFCGKCQDWHNLDSKLGKEHRKFINIIGGRTK